MCIRNTGILALLILTGFSACRNQNNQQEEMPLARVYESYLYPGDMKGHIQPGLSEQDSIRILRQLTDDWVRNQILLKQAETYLPENEKDVEKQVEEYRSSLLIFKYKQYLLLHNIDSVVGEDEIEAYYNENPSNFILNTDVVKALYLKVPVTAPQLSQIRWWYRSGLTYYKEIEQFCQSYADKCMIDTSQWIRFTDLLSQTPVQVENPGRFLAYNRNIESSDSTFYYLIHILDKRMEGTPSPLPMVRQNIYSVIMNKRKLEYIQDLETTVYKDGLSRNLVEIYQK